MERLLPHISIVVERNLLYLDASTQHRSTAIISVKRAWHAIRKLDATSKVKCDWWMGEMIWRVVWRCVWAESGALSPFLTLTAPKLELYVDH
jgi:hypothetical protein